ncbi:MAG: ABC transporter substrate-binding protein [Verrucomicrobiota bacterium]
MKKFLLSLLCLKLVFLFNGCGGSEPTSEGGLTTITLQTDWYAQAEHGGFYQAVVNGYYEEVGLDVKITQGGPNAFVTQKVASRAADFAIGRSDDIIIQIARGIPLVIVSSFMQHDPQALLIHASSEVQDFKDLDGKTVMTTPGAVFLDVIRKKFDIEVNVTPLDYGMSRFINDPDFIQQCFITNEPYYMAKEGIETRTLLLADTGFDPYRIIYANRSYASKNPEIVKAFVAASIKGWNSYMAGPRDKANAMIAPLNPKMSDEFLAYSHQTMEANKLIGGRGETPVTGLILKSRIDDQLKMLRESDLLDKEVSAEEVAPLVYLPPELQNLAQK